MKIILHTLSILSLIIIGFILYVFFAIKHSIENDEMIAKVTEEEREILLAINTKNEFGITKERYEYLSNNKEIESLLKPYSFKNREIIKNSILYVEILIQERLENPENKNTVSKNLYQEYLTSHCSKILFGENAGAAFQKASNQQNLRRLKLTLETMDLRIYEKIRLSDTTRENCKKFLKKNSDKINNIGKKINNLGDSNE